MRGYDIIRKKREGMELTDGEIRFFVDGYTEGSIPDYQASAFLMAAFLQGLSFQETFSLTDAIVHSGKVLDLSRIPGISRENKAAMIQYYYAHGRISYDVMQSLLAGV